MRGSLMALKGIHSYLLQLNPGFQNENMTHIAAQHDTPRGCLLKPTSGQPKVRTGVMLLNLREGN